MATLFTGAWALIRDSVKAWFEDRAALFAAALAYYAVFSLAPLTVIAVAIAGFFVGRSTAAAQLVSQLSLVLGPDVAGFIQEAARRLGNPENSQWPTIISALIAFVGASLFFNQLKVALNAIWGITPIKVKGIQDAFVLARSRAVSVLMVLALGFLLVLNVILGTILAAFGAALDRFAPGISELLPSFSAALLPILGLLTFTLILKAIPDAHVAWRDALVGAALTTLLFVIGVYVIGRYVIIADTGSVYGAAKSFVVFLFWVYYSAQILLFGAEFTWVFAARYGRPIRPTKAAILAGEQQPSQAGG